MYFPAKNSPLLSLQRSSSELSPGLCMHLQSLIRGQLFITPWTVVPQAPLSTGFSRKEYWSGLPVPPPEDLPDSGMAPTSPALACGFLPLSHPRSSWAKVLSDTPTET